MVLQFLKPIILLWAALNALDDIASVMKITRLIVSSLTPFRRFESKDSMCDLCDDIVAGLMAGSGGLQTVPCSWLCLRVPKCMRMCENIQETAANSSKFPCLAAGYCTDEEADEDDIYGLALTQMECEKGPLWSCEPKKYCRRQRKGLRYSCNPKPGIGRWVGMQKAAATHTAALAAGFLTQKRCGEPDAGPFCVVAPSGMGKIAELVGTLLSLLYGGYNSIVAIETPGGDDDQQWLTFWIIVVGLLVLEQAFMRVLLSKFLFYYELKLLVLIWLMFFDGATLLYRRLRRTLARLSPYFAKILDHRSRETAQRQLDIMIDIGGDVVVRRLSALEMQATKNPGRRNSAFVLQRVKIAQNDQASWEYDYADILRAAPTVSLDAAEKLFVLSKWLLSAEGIQEMENQSMSKENVALLLERAAALVSFNPRYLNIHLIGTKPGPIGNLPSMDRNGKVDCYVKFYIRADTENSSSSQSNSEGFQRRLARRTVSSRIIYKKLAPKWNERMELLLHTGSIDSDGNYRDTYTRQLFLVAEAWDADVGTWGICMNVFQVCFLLLTTTLFAGHVTGILDSILDSSTTVKRAWLEMSILVSEAFTFLGFVVCYLKAVVFRADDEVIGRSEVPIEILLDQREHALCLHLQHGVSSGNRGILRVRLSLSE